jgi:transcription initiation factor TFIIIB Brf1 subunit/transcription initiation factor TFIIB
MRCDECNSDENEFDEALGEIVCKGCGLVLITEMFEETVRLVDDGEKVRSSDKGVLGSVITGKGSYKYNKWGKQDTISPSIQTGLVHCNMVLGTVCPQVNLKDRVRELYLILAPKGIFGKSQYEARATALVYYALKENGTPHTFNDVCSEFNPPIKVVKRLVRKINQVFKNKVNHIPVNPQYLLKQTVKKISSDVLFEQQCLKVLEHFEALLVETDFNKGRSYYASIIWIASNVYIRNDITQKLICQRTGFSPDKIWRQTKRILAMIGLTLVSQVKGQELSKIGE